MTTTARLTIRTTDDYIDSFCPVCGNGLKIEFVIGHPFVQCASGGDRHVDEWIPIALALEIEERVHFMEIEYGCREEMEASDGADS